jgi:hypothetical protein
MKFRTQEEMYQAVRGWEYEAGEDFLDYFDCDINVFNFMFWCHGKGYITTEQLQEFEKEDCHGTSYLLGDEDYSVVQDEDDWEACCEKAYRILAEFLVLTETYQRRVDTFLKDN